MSVNGKPNEGDVYLETDGYMRVYCTNSNGVWYDLLLSKTNHMYVGDARTKPYLPADAKFVMNIKELLISIRQDIQDESSS